MPGATVLDIGSMIVNPNRRHKISYREIFEPNYEYTGMDIASGPNVDIVGYENIVDVYDVVVAGQVMEHVNRPWEWLKSITKYYRHYVCIIAPNTHKEHRHPIDTYRYFPDGMRDLFDYAGITPLEIYRSGKDTIGIGR
jgi:hypothetical protein